MGVSQLNCVFIKELFDFFSLMRREVRRRLLLRKRNESIKWADLAVKMFFLFGREGFSLSVDICV